MKRNWSMILCLVAGSMATSTLAVTNPMLPLSAALAVPIAGVADAGKFFQLPPSRIVDTRSGLGGTQGPLQPGQQFDVQVTGTGGVPAGASAVAVNLTAAEARKAGYVTLFPAGGSSSSSNVNPTGAGSTIANLAIVSLSASGKLTVVVESGGHVLLDVAGYWMPAATATSGRFVAVTPVRTLDTRSPGRAKLATGGSINAQITGVAGIPADASAVAVTITAADASGPGFITAWATGQPRPNASISNQPAAGATVPNTAIVPIGAGGQISVYTEGGAHILVDIAGWFTGDSAPASSDGLFVPVTPTRIADTRRPGTLKELVAGLTVELPVIIPGGVPAGAQAGAVAVNLTIADPWDDGYLTASPSQVPVPNASNLNYTRDVAAAGLTLSRLGANGNLNLQSYSGGDVIADIAGWFTGPPAADGGFRPTKCENLMQYLHDNAPNSQAWDNEVRTVDRTISSSQRVLARGEVFARIGLRCEYVLLFRPNPDGVTGRISRIDVLGTQPERIITQSLEWDLWTPTADGRSIFFLEGASTAGLSTSIRRLDVRTGAITTVRDSGFYYDVSDVSADGRFLDYTAPRLEGFLGVYRLDLTTGASSPIPGAVPAEETDVSPDGAYRALVFSTSATDSSMRIIGANTLQRPGVYRARFTPQGELVESKQRGPVLITAAPYMTGSTILLNNEVDFAPNFPKFALM